MRVLVTGGAGYIGSVLSPLLLKRGHHVRLFDRFFFGDEHVVSWPKQVEVERGDIRTVKAAALRDIDVVIHLAALSNDPMANFAPDLNYQINTEATLRLARLAKRAGVKRFIFASSCSIYHHGALDNHLCMEADPVDPQEYYSRSKYLAELVILPLATDDFVVTILRMGTVGGYSPRLRLDLALNTMVKTGLSLGKLIVNGGKQYRPLVDVRDVAACYLKLVGARATLINRHIFNIAHKNYLILPLAKEVRQVLRRQLKRDFDLEIRNSIRDRTYRVSTRKLARVLKFKPRWSMTQSVLSLLPYVARRGFDFDNPLYYNIERMKQLMPTLG